MSPHYLVKLEMLIAHVLSLTYHCYQFVTKRNPQNLSHCNCGLQIR